MKLFWTILKYFGMTAGSLTILWGAFTLLDDIRDGIGDVKEDVTEVRRAVDSSLVCIRESNLRIAANEKAIQLNTGHTEVLVDSYLDYIKGDEGLTKDEFVEYMDPFLEYIKKNSSSNSSNDWIPFDGNDFVSTNTTGNTKVLRSQ